MLTELKNRWIFFFMDRETYVCLPLTRWLDISRRPIKDHPELHKDEQKAKTIIRESGEPMELLSSFRLVGDTLKGKEYDIEKVEKVRLWWSKL